MDHLAAIGVQVQLPEVQGLGSSGSCYSTEQIESSAGLVTTGIICAGVTTIYYHMHPIPAATKVHIIAVDVECGATRFFEIVLNRIHLAAA